MSALYATFCLQLDRASAFSAPAGNLGRPLSNLLVNESQVLLDTAFVMDVSTMQVSSCVFVCVCMCVSLFDRSSFIIVYVCWHLILVSPMVISGASTL